MRTAAPSSPKQKYIYAGGALVAKVTSTATYYYHQDHLSNRLITNSTGGVDLPPQSAHGIIRRLSLLSS